MKDESPLIIELKLNLNLTVLLQAVDRLQITDCVYIGVPSGLSVLKKQPKKILKLIRMLGLGLMTVNPKSQKVTVVCDPSTYQPKQIKERNGRLLAEFQQRVGDPNNAGASTRLGTVTAYRQKAITIAAYLQQNGTSKAAEVAKQLAEPNSRSILYRNVYGWFDGFGKGMYGLSPRGANEITQWQQRQSDFNATKTLDQ